MIQPFRPDHVSRQPRTSVLLHALTNTRIRWHTWIFALALILRLTVLALTFDRNDAVEYYDDAKIALNIVSGNGFSVNYDYRNFLLYSSLLENSKLDNPITEGTRPTALKQPGYALLLAGIFYLFGPKNFLVVFLLHAVISAVTASMVYLLLRKSASHLAALVTSFGVAVYPPFMGHPVTVPESTTLQLFFIVALWLCLVWIREHATWALWIGAGLLAGMAVLIEPIMLPFSVVGFGYAACLDRRSLRIRLTAFATAMTLIFVILTPWLVRNYIVFGKFPLLKTGAMGHVFVWGLKFSGNGSWIPDDTIIALEKAGRELNELQEEEAIKREVMSRFPSHWREYLTSEIPHHFMYLWWDIPTYWSDYSLKYMLGRRIPFLILLFLALPHLLRTISGILRDARGTLHSHVPELAALLLMAAFTAVYSLFGAFHSRYRLPLELGLFIFVAGTLKPFAENICKRWLVPTQPR